MALKILIDYRTMKNPFDVDDPGLHSRLQGKAEFQASALIGTANVRGVCFRVSYKWLVNTRKGLEFKAESTNMAKTYAKQMDYLTQADAVASSDYDTWFQNANSLSQTTLQAWGAKHGHSCAAPYVSSSLGAADPLKGDPDAAMIVGFFGQKRDGKVWGHATAYCCRNNKPQFFDINYGVYGFEAGDNRGDVIQKWIEDKYVNSSKSIKHFALYQIY
jgi:hypothetical protein